jgi:oligopeptidase B
MTIKPPVAEKRDCISSHHGIERNDPYAWLRADNWQEVMREPEKLPADIRSFLDAENAYCESVMADTKQLQEKLFEEMKGRIKEDDSSVPTPDGPFAYASKYVTGAQHPMLVRTAREGGKESILIDGNKEAAGKTFFRLAGASHSNDHKFMAWAFDDKGSEFFTLKVRDLETGKDLEDEITETGGGGVWSACGKYLFYIRVDENHRPSKLFRHEMGRDTADDVLVYEEQDAGFFMGVGGTQSDSFIIIDIHDHQTSECWLIPTDEPTAAPRLIAARETAVEYSVEEANGTLFILTNADGAEDFKIVTAPVDQPGRESWRDLVEHKAGNLVLAHTCYKNFMVRLERVEGLPRIVIYNYAAKTEKQIAFEEEAYSLGMMDGYEFETDTIRFSYSSMTTPSQVYDYDVKTGARVLRKEQEVPSGHNGNDYVTRRIMAPAHDGELVPVSLLYHKDTLLDGSAPLWLYGYGSYGMAMPAGFSTGRLSLVDRGFVYAIAHIRGGKEKGFAWYAKGRREFKQNTFKDFISAGEFLIDQGYTSRGNIVANGGSAGGMLMGAVANMAPDMFKAVIGEVPFVDVLTTMLDDTLPLTPPEWPEWGNPITDKAAYEYIAAYSPIDNVSTKDYPHILAVGGLTDPRVTYWEPAKWVATLREKKTDQNTLLLKTIMDAGHAGMPGRFEQLKETAFVFAFGLKMVT